MMITIINCQYVHIDDRIMIKFGYQLNLAACQFHDDKYFYYNADFEYNPGPNGPSSPVLSSLMSDMQV